MEWYCAQNDLLVKFQLVIEIDLFDLLVTFLLVIEIDLFDLLVIK